MANDATNDPTTVTIDGPRKCNFCADRAKFDFRTLSGRWAYGCTLHWIMNRATSKLGTGNGHRILRPGEK